MTSNFEEMDGSAEWTRISTEADWHQLDRIVGGFHDGVIKQVHWFHRQYVNSAGEMVYAGEPNLWVLIQLQKAEVPAIELLFFEVHEVSLVANNELEATMRLDADMIFLAMSACGSSRVVARQFRYRISGISRRGSGPFDAPF